jgi:hypothetical protein
MSSLSIVHPPFARRIHPACHLRLIVFIHYERCLQDPS